MTDDTVMIEPFQSMGNGERVHLDLSYLKSYCLTPGQVSNSIFTLNFANS